MIMPHHPLSIYCFFQPTHLPSSLLYDASSFPKTSKSYVWNNFKKIFDGVRKLRRKAYKKVYSLSNDMELTVT